MGSRIEGGHQREVGKGSKMQKRTGNQGMNRRNYIKCVYIYIIYICLSLYLYGGGIFMDRGERDHLAEEFIFSQINLLENLETLKLNN